MKNTIRLALMIALFFSFGSQAIAKETGKKECSKTAEAKFKSLDKDENGFLSLEEFKACPSGEGCAKKSEKLFNEFDKDKSGTLSFEEFKEMAKQCKKSCKKGKKSS